MNVAILHCHYRRGGVTQVVENHVAGLTEKLGGRIVLISGGRNDGLSEQTIRRTEPLVVEDLDYDAVLAQKAAGENNVEPATLPARANAIAARIDQNLRSLGLSPEDTVLHWHNHALGKNVAAPLAIATLDAAYRYRQLLQIHDFAEDFRPENYLRIAAAAFGTCPEDDFSSDNINTYNYPNSTSIRYATLTSGDAEVLDQLGIDSDRIHLLPNSVTLGDATLPDAKESLEKIRRAAALPEDARWCVYPVRGIRRKNVGELLLLSRLAGKTTYLGITLPPTTAIELRSYERWRSLAETVAPKVIFDAGTFADVSFLENLAAADLIVSTSVAEGFGMAFLEPWLAHRGVVARRLPGVVNDFEKENVRLDRFYDSIQIPGDAAWIETCRQESAEAFRKAWRELPEQYGHAFSVRQSADDAPGKTIDFATLTTTRQIEVLRHMAADHGFEDEVRALNDQLARWMTEPFGNHVLDHNARTITANYALGRSAERLLSIYRDALQSKPSREGERIKLNANVSVVDLICGERTYFPCRTELEIAR